MTDVRNDQEDVVEGRKDITIRGVDSYLYSRAAEIARRTGKTMGETVSEALRLFIDVSEGIRSSFQPLAEGVREAGERAEEALSYISPAVISDLEELEVSKSDLERFNRRVVFQGITRLIFADDVDEDTVDRYVALIRDCKEVRVPKELPKLFVLSRCRNVGKLVME